MGWGGYSGAVTGGEGTYAASRLRSGLLVALWGSFLLVHMVLGWLALDGPGYPLGDVEWVYTAWTRDGLAGAGWVGIDRPWVYPIAAILPMLLARIGDEAAYAPTWLSMVMLLNAGAFALLIRSGDERRRIIAGFWWLLFLLVLGPIALGRIDSVTVPLALAGLLLLVRSPRVAVMLITLAAWMKVWPAAIVAALVIAVRDRRTVIGTALLTSVAIAGVALILGGGGNILSFIGGQTGRGLQAEAPPSTPFLWIAASGGPAEVYYDTRLLTYQVRGDGAELVAAVTTPLLIAVVAGILVVGALAARRGIVPERLLPPLVLALVMAMIALNKVGSPQFVSWIAVPVVVWLLWARAGADGPESDRPRDRIRRLVAAVTLAVAALTQVMYPYLYGYLIGLEQWMLVVATLRNGLEVALLVGAVAVLVGLARSPRGADGGVQQPASPASRKEGIRS